MKILVYIGILLVGFQSSAQKKLHKEIAFDSQKIVIQLHDIDNIELFHHNLQKVIVDLEDYEENPSNLVINEGKDIINIISTTLGPLNKVKTDKFCAEQPLFSTYRIFLPKGSEIALYYENGNFKALDFDGSLTLKLNKGDINLDNFKGMVDIELFSGNVNAKIKNGTIDIISNKGTIETNIKSESLKKTSTSLKGVFVNSEALIKVRTIRANLALYSTLTQ